MGNTPFPTRLVTPGWRRWLPGGLAAAMLAACGGAEQGDQSGMADTGERARALAAQPSRAGDPFAGLSFTPDARQSDAVRLAQQASFGPNSALITAIEQQGPAAWVAGQMAATGSAYTSGKGDKIHKNTSGQFFCDTDDQKGNPYCWRDWYSPDPLAWDFYRNAVEQPDQLRQRTAFALQQVFVISGYAVYGTYGWRYYQNMLLDNAFGNYRELLRRVALAPLMGQYLNNVNNDKALPNENFARELLQLFSIGACQLQADGKLPGGRCKPTYNNEMVRNYAYALTGWTYPKGGKTWYGCWPEGANCEYLDGDMVPAPKLRDDSRRALLSGVVVPAGTDAKKALALVLDSLMQHPNMAPFVAQHMIQHLVTSNPAPDYVARVGQAFVAGQFTSGGQTFGTGQRGDMAAVVAAVLLDPEARSDRWNTAKGGHLREPILEMTGALRALNGRTDGDALIYWWGPVLRQPVFYPPSVFSFYASDYPVAGSTLVGPEFGIHNANAALQRLNYLTYLLDWDGSDPNPDTPHAIGTKVDLSAFLADAKNPARLVDGLSMMTLGRRLEPGPRDKVLTAVSWWTAANDPDTWQLHRVRTAAFLVLGSPDYQVQH
ncbi:MAG: DUF1800 family protein [Burkholderiaceae bacterium]